MQAYTEPVLVLLSWWNLEVVKSEANTETNTMMTKTETESDPYSLEKTAIAVAMRWQH